MYCVLIQITLSILQRAYNVNLYIDGTHTLNNAQRGAYEIERASNEVIVHRTLNEPKTINRKQ